MSARLRLAFAAIAAVVLVAVAAPAYAATTATTTPKAKTPPPPPRPHPKVNPDLPPGVRLLRIVTVPPIAGATFTFGGVTTTTGDAGDAQLSITAAQRSQLVADRNGTLTLTNPTVAVDPGIRSVFTGWSGNGSYRQGIETQTATFRTEYLVGFRFVNRRGAPVTPNLLQSMQLQSSVGETIDLKTADPIWVQGSQVVTGSQGLEARDIFYKINRVVVAGSNVVNSAQQRFFPSQTSTVNVRLLFYTVRFVATDAMFGGGIGKGIDLQYPDGRVRHVDFGKGHAVTVDDIPRGDYHVTVIGGGLKMSRPVSISRDQQADLDVISYLDVGIVGLALGAVALAVLWFGLRLRQRHRGQDARPTRRAKRQERAAKREQAREAAALAAVGGDNGDRPERSSTEEWTENERFLVESRTQEPR
ncbi:MAG TPA: hypothetical protein VIB48_05275 [Acidimicrobiia bacterium]